ncbi:MAG: hypothetical protein OXI38_09670, partial [Bacteroidota bacterium]|nr:hypothetical protein [Bacteroidota bacterium]
MTALLASMDGATVAYSALAFCACRETFAAFRTNTAQIIIHRLAMRTGILALLLILLASSAAAQDRAKT